MKRTYLILFAVCLSFVSFSQERKFNIVAASKLATLTIPAGVSKIGITTLPEKVELANKTSSSLHSVFTKSNARGEFYKMGNNLIRVRGVDQPISNDFLLKMSKERFIAGSPLESRQYEEINGYKVLTINLDTDANYSFMTAYIQNPSNSNYLIIEVLYPAKEKSSSIPKIKSFIKSAKFK